MPDMNSEETSSNEEELNVSVNDEPKSNFETNVSKGGIIVSASQFSIIEPAIQVQFQPVSVLSTTIEGSPVSSGISAQSLSSEIYHGSVTLASVQNTGPRSLNMANNNVSSTQRGRKRTATSRLPAKLKEPAAVARRNARERRRVKMVNDGFLRLRKHVPTDPKNKKLSKVKTLRLAIDYIKHLQQLLVESSVKQAHSAPSYTNLAGIPEDLDTNPSWLHAEHLVSNFSDISANFSLV